MKVGDNVRVKLREPVGNATTETANDYLALYLGHVGEIYEQRSSRTFRVKFIALSHTRWTGTFYDYELEVIND